jgi:lipoate-protein ligase B
VLESKDCIAVWNGCLSYPVALDLQMEICGLKKRGFDKDVLLLLEHPPTITLGRNAKRDHLIAGEKLLKARGIGLYEADRGGDITFHGPGQLVGYPILSLTAGERDVHGYMRKLEESLIRLLGGYGIEGGRDSKYTGVWTPNGKIAAMGVHISRWVTRHGFALNVNTDISYFDLIVPCGIVGKSVTSMQKHLSHALDLEEIADRYIMEFGTVFHRNMIKTDNQELCDELRIYAENLGLAHEEMPPNAPVA